MDALANQQLRTLNEFQSNAENHAYKFSAEELAARHQGILNDLAQRKMAKASAILPKPLQLRTLSSSPLSLISLSLNPEP